MKLIRRELIATYDYEVQGLEDPFYFRLEIYQSASDVKGSVFRLDRYRLSPTFPQDENGEPFEKDDAVLFINDEFIDHSDLLGSSKDEVITLFEAKLKTIFNL